MGANILAQLQELSSPSNLVTTAQHHQNRQFRTLLAPPLWHLRELWSDLCSLISGVCLEPSTPQNNI